VSWRSTSGAAVVLSCAACTLEPLPVASGPLPVEDVEILVDENGVPHIYAASDRDAFFGAGYIQATHRLYQMDMARRRAHGRMAEVLGPDGVADDELARLFDWRGLGQRVAELTRERNLEEWGVLEAWAAGVNQRVDEVLSGKAPLPYGFGPAEMDFLPERWSAADPLILATMTRFGNDQTIDYELFATIGRQLYPEGFDAIELHRPAHDVFTVPPEDLPPVPRSDDEAPAVVPAPQRDRPRAPLRFDALRRLGELRPGGSNNWAIDGRFTDSGRPLLCGDPHQGFSFPGVFYALHINSADAGGSFDVAGFTFPGTAGVALGQNARVAWTATTAFGDVMDTWEVPEIDESTVAVGGVPQAVTLRSETIRVRGSDDEIIEVREVPGFGVILPDDIAPLPIAAPGNVLVNRWIGYAVDGPAELLDIDRADSIDAFEATIDRQKGLNFNMVSADAGGISLRVGLDVPLRDVTSTKPWLVQDGSEPASQWTAEMLPRARLPRGRAAETGYIVTANNDPFGFTANGRVDDDPWYFGPLFAPGWRAKRVRDEIERLTEAGEVSLDDVMALAMDLRSNLADDLLPLLDEAWSALGSDPALAAYRGRPELETLADVLLAWDRRMARDQPGALVFHVFAHELARVVLYDDMDLMYYPALDLQPVFVLKIASLVVRGAYPRSAELLVEGRDVALLEALSATAAFLEERFGGVDPRGYRWGDMHFTSWESSLGEGLDFGLEASDGGESTVNVSSSGYAPDGTIADRFVSQGGPVFRMCFSFAQDGVPEMRFNFPLGNVADPASPHFDDIGADWHDGGFRTMPFRRADVEAAAESTLVLPAAP
jgi:penicillin amidase